ncbi:MAG: hypothetical protein NTX25_11375 [Proteobacteria bacterium]|nr:hypothetical protein [Pseudomonadota bacterium]
MDETLEIFSGKLINFSLPKPGFSASSELKWLNGENICTGSWNYTQMAACGYADDTNSPIYQTVYDDITVVDSCRVKEVYDVAETADVPIEWEDSWTAPSCGPYQPADIDALNYWVSRGISDIDGPIDGRCKKRQFKKCIEHYKVFKATCKFERRVARTIAEADKCPTRIEKRPREVVVGYNKLFGIHPSCPGAKALVSDKLLPKSSILASDIILQSVQCSTLDDVAATTPEIVRAKFDAYMAQAFELAGVQGQCQLKQPLYHGLQAIAENGIDALAADQLSLAFEFIDLLTAECDQSIPKTPPTLESIEQMMDERTLNHNDNLGGIKAVIEDRILLVTAFFRMSSYEYRLNLDTRSISKIERQFMSADVISEASKGDALYKELADGLKSLISKRLASSSPEGKILNAYLESSL